MLRTQAQPDNSTSVPGVPPWKPFSTLLTPQVHFNSAATKESLPDLSPRERPPLEPDPKARAWTLYRNRFRFKTKKGLPGSWSWPAGACCQSRGLHTLSLEASKPRQVTTAARAASKHL